MPPTDPKSDHGQSDSKADTSLPVFNLASEGEIDLGAIHASDDMVNLDALPELPSGQSLTSWTAIIRRQQAAQARPAATGTQGGRPVRPGPAVPGGRRGPPAGRAPRRPGDTSDDPPGPAPVFAPALPAGYSESDIDLGPGSVAGESQVKFDIPYPPSDAGGAMPAPGAAPVRGGLPVRRPGPGRGRRPVRLRRGPGPVRGGPGGRRRDAHDGTGRSSILDVLLKEAGNGPPGRPMCSTSATPRPSRPGRPCPRPTARASPPSRASTCPAGPTRAGGTWSGPPRRPRVGRRHRPVRRGGRRAATSPTPARWRSPRRRSSSPSGGPRTSSRRRWT